MTDESRNDIPVVNWCDVHGNLYNRKVTLSMFYICVRIRRDACKLRGQGKWDVPRPAMITYGRDYIIAKLRNDFVLPLKALSNDELHQLLTDAIEGILSDA